MCWDCYDHPKGDPHSNFIRGGVDVTDFDDEIRYRHPKRRRKMKEKRNRPRPGCPENDWNKHVFVWVEQAGIYESNFFYKFYGYYKNEYEVCCGCGKVGKSRRTEKYSRINEKIYTKRYGNEFEVKRGEPVARNWRRFKPSLSYFSFENDDKEFKDAHRQWAIERGYPTWYYA